MVEPHCRRTSGFILMGKIGEYNSGLAGVCGNKNPVCTVWRADLRFAVQCNGRES